MNQSLEKLYRIGQKKSRHIIGLMSGTSLDGLDIALCEIRGSGIKSEVSLLKFSCIKYDDDFKEEIKTIFSKKIISAERLCLLNEWIAIRHASIINDRLQNWNILNSSIDLIASHGQTIYHAPAQQHRQIKFGNGTLQIGDGDHIAVNTGIITISDFRQKQIAAGGEGAPLAAYGDYLLFAEKDADVIVLNIGGIANFTYLPAGMDFSKIISSDTGPGNTIMDAFIQAQFPGRYFDKDAEVAKQGTVNKALLDALKDDAFFRLPFPKTTGPELFNLMYVQQALTDCGIINPAVNDIMATLNSFTADGITDAISTVTNNHQKLKIFLSGGGIHNPLLMENIKNNLPETILLSTAEKGIEPDAKEAVLFAILANECVAGNKNSFGMGTKNSPAVAMGKISFAE